MNSLGYLPAILWASGFVILVAFVCIQSLKRAKRMMDAALADGENALLVLSTKESEFSIETFRVIKGFAQSGFKKVAEHKASLVQLDTELANGTINGRVAPLLENFLEAAKDYRKSLQEYNNYTTKKPSSYFALLLGLKPSTNLS